MAGAALVFVRMIHDAQIAKSDPERPYAERAELERKVRFVENWWIPVFSPLCFSTHPNSADGHVSPPTVVVEAKIGTARLISVNVLISQDPKG